MNLTPERIAELKAHATLVMHAKHEATLLAALDENQRMREALEKLIEMNRQHAEDQYGDADKAESWACVRIAREAINAEKPHA